MDYSIFSLHTLKSMSRDLDKEIIKTIKTLNSLREQYKNVLMLLNCDNNNKSITEETLIKPF